MVCYLYFDKSCLKTRGQAKATEGQAVVTHSFNPRIWEAESDGSL